MNLKPLLQEYYDNCKVMQLATLSGDQPWLCTVTVASDSDFNLYWSSLKSRRHSQEIKAHSKVAVTIVKDVAHKQALQMTGEAFEVSEADLERVNKIYAAKYGDKPERLVEVKAGTRAFWVFKPTTISFWDEVNFPDSPKQEYPL